MINLTIRKLAVTYDKYLALKIDKMELEGSIIGIIGPNGAGKSTFIKSILNLTPATYESLDIAKGDDSVLPHRDMAFCPEIGSVFLDISVRDYLLFWERISKGKADFERFQITPLLNKKGYMLSKGEKRRVQTCAGFMMKPKLFLFDEPFDGLDVERTQDLIGIIKSYTETDFIVSSHRMDVVESLCDQIILVNNGEIEAFGTLSELVATICPVAVRTKSQEWYKTLVAQLKREKINYFAKEEDSGYTLLASQKLEFRTEEYEAIRPNLTDMMTLFLRRTNHPYALTHQN